MTDDPGWRDDPTWKLVEYDEEWWKANGQPPPQRPTLTAELAQPALWASQYDGRRVVATWARMAD